MKLRDRERSLKLLFFGFDGGEEVMEGGWR